MNILRAALHGLFCMLNSFIWHEILPVNQQVDANYHFKQRKPFISHTTKTLSTNLLEHLYIPIIYSVGIKYPVSFQNIIQLFESNNSTAILVNQKKNGTFT